MRVALRLVLGCCHAVLTSVLEPHVGACFVDEQRPVSVVAVDHITCIGVLEINPLTPQVVGLELHKALHVLTCVAVACLYFHDCFPLASLRVFPRWEVALLIYISTCFHVLSLYCNIESLGCQVGIRAWYEVFYSIIPKSSVSTE